MSKERLQQLEKERDDHVTKIFWVALQIIIIFGVPLAIAVLIGLKIGGNAKWIALPFAFIFSWFVMAFYYQRLSSKMKKIDAEINTLREKLGVKKPTPNYDDNDKEE